jgi:glycerol uptake facilitator-like aquaporin
MKKLLAETSGTALIVIAVNGSAFLAQSLSNDRGVQLIINCMSTVMALYISIILFANMSGAHFNPIVSVIAFFHKKVNLSELVLYVTAQVIGAFLGAGISNIMFSQQLFAISNIDRSLFGFLIGEVIASAGLILIIFAQVQEIANDKRAKLISLWIASAYFFTSSTAFANPAVSLGRIFTKSPAGINADSFLRFVLAQILGGVFAYAILRMSNQTRAIK